MAPISLAEAKDRWLSALEERIDLSLTDGSYLGCMSHSHFLTGGKRIRALLPPWLCHNLGGAAESALDLGAGLEILHNATLVHDDLQDGDTHRRGKPTVWRRFGDAQSINVGDSLFFQGIERLSRAPAGAALVGPVCRAMHRVVLGQVMEFQLQLSPEDEGYLPPTVDAFITMAKGKTGALFGACLLSGAVAAGLTGDDAKAYETYGEDLGLLFQVQDDYLDLVGDKGREVRGADLAEGKRSYPVVWALTHGDAPTRAGLSALLSRPRDTVTQADIDGGIALLKASGALDHTAAWLRDARDRALTSSLHPTLPGLAERFLDPVLHAL